MSDRIKTMTRRNTIPAFGIILFLGLVILLIRTPYWTAITKSTKHFVVHSSDQRIRYESGAEEYADKIAAALPTAINTVVEKHAAGFIKPFNIYVCNSQKSLNEFVAAPSCFQIRGTALLGDVYIAPSAFDFMGMDTHQESLTHELSHLHLRQRLGFIKTRKIPHWFHEGFGDYVAGSGGEGVEESLAVEFILGGNHFVPVESGKIFVSNLDAINGLTGPMFHKQSTMFVNYIISTDPDKFKLFFQQLLEGRSFERSFQEIYGSSIQKMWVQFRRNLNG